MLTPDPRYDFLVVIPTVGDADTLLPTVRQVFRHMEGTRTHLVLSVNPINAPAAKAALESMMSELDLPEGCTCTVWFDGGPVGFAQAVNCGLHAGTKHGWPETVIVLNDDVIVTAGWARYLRNALDCQTIRMPGEPAGPDGHRPDRSVEGYGRIGMAGPASDEVAGIQRVGFPPEEAARAAADPDGYAAWFRQANVNNYQACDFLSGFCVAIDRACLDDVLSWGPNDLPKQDGDERTKRAILFDENFGVGGFEDNDLCVRLERAHWRCVVAGDLFVHHLGHRTLDRHFAGQRRGMANRATYYEKWRPFTQCDRVIACYRTKLNTANDLTLLRGSIQRAAALVDGIALVLTNNPLDIGDAWDWPIASGLVLDAERHPVLHQGQPQYDTTRSLFKPYDWALFQACNQAGPAEIMQAFRLWISQVIADAPNARDIRGAIRVQVWDGVFNERDERNASIALAEGLGPDWILSIDHDEVIEDRIDRAWLERLVRHPDPMVRAWDVGWYNHWDSTRLCRVDRPWSDGGTYTSGMRGFRLWRSAGRRIVGGTEIGFHCGNCPDHDVMSKRVASLRFRHYGYLRRQDRERKHAWYRKMDPRPVAELVGGMGYHHLVSEEGMQVAPYWVDTGIGLTFLMYGGEDHEDMARWLDQFYGVVDHVVAVWTDTSLDEPGTEAKRIGEAFGIEWVRHRFTDDLAACRNAGLDALRKHPHIGWAAAIDPDEGFSDTFAAALSWRRMAECSNSYGFTQRFVNQRPPETQEEGTHSETIRFIRLDPDEVMRYTGRVHEGFDEAIHRLTDQGIHPQIRTAPHICINRGLAGTPEVMEQKLRKYSRLLFLELVDNPKNGHAWMSIGLQYANENRLAEARLCFERSCAVARESYLPFKELALWHMRVARTLYQGAIERISQNHEYRRIVEGMSKWLDAHAPDQPILGLALHGRAEGDWLGPVPYSDDEWTRILAGEEVKAVLDPTSPPLRVVTYAVHEIVPVIPFSYPENGNGTHEEPSAESAPPV